MIVGVDPDVFGREIRGPKPCPRVAFFEGQFHQRVVAVAHGIGDGVGIELDGCPTFIEQFKIV